MDTQKDKHFALAVGQTITYLLCLFVLAKLLKIYAPIFNWEQVSIIIGVIGFLIKIREQSNEQREDRISNIEKSLGTLQDKLDLHVNIYAHLGIEEDYRNLSKEVMKNSAEIRYGWSMRDIEDRLDRLEDGTHG